MEKQKNAFDLIFKKKIKRASITIVKSQNTIRNISGKEGHNEEEKTGLRYQELIEEYLTDRHVYIVFAI